MCLDKQSIRWSVRIFMVKLIVSERQHAILRSAQVLFAELGYDGASFEKISGRAGVAFGLIRHYYKSKNNLYVAAVACSMENAHSYIVEKTADATSGLDALLNGVYSYIEFINDGDGQGKLIVSAEPDKIVDAEGRETLVKSFDEMIVSIFTSFIARGVDDLSIRKIDPHHSALVVLGLIHGAAQVSTLAGSGVSTNEILDFIANSVMNGDKR